MFHLDATYKFALLLETKSRILMSLSNSQKLLESSFYEAMVKKNSIFSKNRFRSKMKKSTIMNPIID